MSQVLTINEIFHSIQGESSYAGRPCVFVRLTACDLRCDWCDTPYAFHEGTRMALDDVLARVEGFGCRLVELTGGEPLLQQAVYPLMEALLARGYAVLLETGGHINLERVPAEVVRVMDVKCPGSGEASSTDWTNVGRLLPHDQVKFVVRDRADYEYARAVIARHDLSARVGDVLLSPVHDVLAPILLAGWILEDRLPVRLQLQVHKYIWGPDVRGV